MFFSSGLCRMAKLLFHVVSHGGNWGPKSTGEFPTQWTGIWASLLQACVSLQLRNNIISSEKERQRWLQPSTPLLWCVITQHLKYGTLAYCMLCTREDCNVARGRAAASSPKVSPRNLNSWATEMGRWVKCLLCSDDLNIHHLYKKPGMTVCACNPSTGRGRDMRVPGVS